MTWKRDLSEGKLLVSDNDPTLCKEIFVTVMSNVWLLNSTWIIEYDEIYTQNLCRTLLENVGGIVWRRSFITRKNWLQLGGGGGEWPYRIIGWPHKKWTAPRPPPPSPLVKIKGVGEVFDFIVWFVSESDAIIRGKHKRAEQQRRRIKDWVLCTRSDSSKEKVSIEYCLLRTKRVQILQKFVI